MISFESDYNNGMLPEILEALGKTNSDKTSGYGFDPYSESAKEKIRKAVDNENAEVFFLIPSRRIASSHGTARHGLYLYAD